MAIVLPKLSRRRSSSGFNTESQPALRLSLCNSDGLYRAGGELKATWRISRVSVDELRRLEISVLWHTEGKGDEDLHVHHFERITDVPLKEIGVENEQSIQCVLPASPLSYHGQLIRLSWCVRMRLFLEDGREVLSESPFYVVTELQTAPCVATPSEGETQPEEIQEKKVIARASRASQTRSTLASLRR
ncbi:MAG: hypothetical protein VXZ38_06560 [Planctomycetota bacterium]|nr:hypothetical protein [Planctomycetota bacterium]